MNAIKHLFALVFLVLVMQNAHCDIIPDDSHYVKKCVKITNISEYDNLVILGYIWHAGNFHEDTYEVSSSECLTKDYKLNTLRLFGIQADYISGKDIDKIDLPNDTYALETNIEINPYAGYYHDSIPIDEIEEYYKILGFTDTSVVIFKWKAVFGFNNGLPDSIVTYDYTGDVSLLSQKITTGITQNKRLTSNIKLYPNPADKFLTADIFDSYVGPINAQLISADGKIATTKLIIKNSEFVSVKFSTSNLAKGIYFLKLQFGEALVTEQIVIR